MVGHYLARSGGHSYCSSRDVILFACHLIKENRVIKVSGDYNDTRPQGKSPPTLPSLVVIDNVEVEIQRFYFVT